MRAYDRWFVLCFLLIMLYTPVSAYSGSSNTLQTLGVDLVQIPAGVFVMGDAHGEPNEDPSKESVRAFRIMRDEVTNTQFKLFIEDTHYVTDVEQSGFAYVWTGRWRTEKGLSWYNPHNFSDRIDRRMSHPVIQVSALDATKFCQWLGLRLPSEKEWEYAARGKDQRKYPWGNQAPRSGQNHHANFGTTECCAADAGDGYLRTSPVGQYPLGDSAFGLRDMAGNVWEWTSTPFPGQPDQVVLRGGGWGNNPYCLRVSYRHANPPDIGLNMVGFRCAGDAAE
ncbi:formylglycine-generating enzyme family protein [Pseudomonadota bacterium]